MIELNTVEQLEEAKQWAYKNLPMSSIIYLWLQLKTRHFMNESSTCFVDQIPNPTVIASVNYFKKFGMENYPFVHFYTSLSSTEEDVEKFLMDICQVIGAEKIGGLMAYATNYDWCPTVRKVIADRLRLNASVKVWEDKLYYMPKEEMDKILMEDIDAPQGYIFDTLKPEEAGFVDSVYPDRSEGTEKSMENRIRILPSTCLRENDPKRQLVSFELMHDMTGYMHHLYTVPEFRRKGLAKIVERKQAQKMMQHGYTPVKMISPGNEEGEKMTEACHWWKYLGKTPWMRFGDERMAKIYERTD